MPSIYTFTEYSPEWPLQFERAAADLRALWGDEIITIHHVGSTSVPGLAAKPIIDLLPLVRNIERIFFTRHGESQANVERIISNRRLPHALTAQGRTQSMALAEQLVDKNMAAIYASPILRAQQTAQIVGQRLGAPVTTTTAALAEFDCGVMEGRGDADAWAAHNAVVDDWAAGQLNARIPEGESFNDMRARFVPFVGQLIAENEHTDHSFLLVAHGNLLYHMLPLMLANVDRAFITQQGMRNCVLISAAVQNGQITCRAWDETALPTG